MLDLKFKDIDEQDKIIDRQNQMDNYFKSKYS